MSCLYTFCISHFEEKDMYSKMAEVGLELDKADFAVAGYEVDERKYPRQGPKEPSTSAKKKMKVDETMTIDLSTDESDDSYEDVGVIQLGQENTAAEDVSLDTSSEDEEKAESEGQQVPLEGSTLGGVNYDGEDPLDLARARLAATPRMLFASTSQPSSSNPEHERRPSFSSPPNPPLRRRSSRIAEFVERRSSRGTATDDPETPILVASQASVSETPAPELSVNQLMISFMQEMRESQAANQRHNLNMFEQQRLDTESRLEEQRKEMNWRLEQQRQDMVTISKETVKAVVNQVPLMVQNALMGVMNVAPLQLQGPTTSQPALMITEGLTTPQGSGTSTHGESSRMGVQTQRHESAEPNPGNERSESPNNTLADFATVTMEVDDIPQPTGSPAAG
jgi:hypothetical protein